VRQSPLHGVIDLPRRRLLQRLLGVLLHLSFRLKEYRVIFCALVGFAVVVHAVQRLVCEWTSATTTVLTWCVASLTVLARPLVKGSLVSFLWRWSKVLLPVFWWPIALRINVVH
jgi:hypothetical protein